MTDQKPLPCAWCGREAAIDQIAFQDEYYWCCNSFCELGPDSNESLVLEDWNKRQTAILKQRRKDFEAGASLGFERCNLSPLYPTEYGYSVKAMTISPDDFEDYIKRGKE